MGKKITLICEYCGKEFQRWPSTIAGRRKSGTKNFYCSKSCAGKFKKPPGSKKRVSHPEFRHLLMRARSNVYSKAQNGRELAFNLTINDLITLWDKQSGRCAISDIAMVLNNITGPPIFNQASIDRINPDLGYTKDNVRLICLMANYALNRFNDEDFTTLCRGVAARAATPQ